MRSQPPIDVDALVTRLERLQRVAEPLAAPAEAELDLSFSQLHAFEICPVRYRLEQVWHVPAPPDELLPKPARRGGSALGAAVHEALRQEGDTVAALRAAAESFNLGPEDVERGVEMLTRYARHPLAAATTLGTEVEFTLRFEGVRVRGAVDRVAELDGATVLVDYKTNRTLDARLRDAYATQLRIYALAAAEGLLPGSGSPRLTLFHLPTGEAIEVDPDPEAARRRVLAAAAAIRSGDFELKPEHASRPCFLCAYRPACAHARA